MDEESKAMRALHILLRPGFGAAIMAAQFLSTREGIFASSVPLLIVGGLLVAAAVGLWAASAVHLAQGTKAGRLVQSGPYRIVRHPIYASVLLLGLGLGLIFFSWIQILIVVASTPFWWLECKREEEEMSSEFGEAYAEYQERTSMLIPGLL